MLQEESNQDVSALLMAWSGGDGDALDRLTPIVYHELRRLARHYMQQERARSSTTFCDWLQFRVCGNLAGRKEKREAKYDPCVVGPLTLEWHISCMQNAGGEGYLASLRPHPELYQWLRQGAADVVVSAILLQG